VTQQLNLTLTTSNVHLHGTADAKTKIWPPNTRHTYAKRRALTHMRSHSRSSLSADPARSDRRCSHDRRLPDASQRIGDAGVGRRTGGNLRTVTVQPPTPERPALTADVLDGALRAKRWDDVQAGELAPAEPPRLTPSGSTSTAARSRSATRSAHPALASSAVSRTSSNGAAADTASPESASGWGRAGRRSRGMTCLQRHAPHRPARA
jgi:hypothetical protein